MVWACDVRSVGNVTKIRFSAYVDSRGAADGADVGLQDWALDAAVDVVLGTEKK